MSGRVAVKVCGITSVADGRAVATAGADAVGFVFWQRSPRAVEPEKAAEIAAALPPFVARVGVFVDESPVVIGRIAERVGLDVIQLHGDESPDVLAALPRRVLKALRVTPGFGAADLERWRDAAGVLLDAGTAERPGGTGRRLDWNAVAALRPAARWLALAGGLDPGNVVRAVCAVRPDAVDVSSGVEAAPGRKDAERVRAFVAAVRAAEEEGA